MASDLSLTGLSIWPYEVISPHEEGWAWGWFCGSWVSAVDRGGWVAVVRRVWLGLGGFCDLILGGFGGLIRADWFGFGQLIGVALGYGCGLIRWSDDCGCGSLLLIRMAGLWCFGGCGRVWVGFVIWIWVVLVGWSRMIDSVLVGWLGWLWVVGVGWFGGPLAVGVGRSGLCWVVGVGWLGGIGLWVCSCDPCYVLFWLIILLFWLIILLRFIYYFNVLCWNRSLFGVFKSELLEHSYQAF